MSTNNKVPIEFPCAPYHRAALLEACLVFQMGHVKRVAPDILHAQYAVALREEPLEGYHRRGRAPQCPLTANAVVEIGRLGDGGAYPELYDVVAKCRIGERVGLHLAKN